MDFIEPCFGIGHNLSLICQMTSEDIKHQLIIIIPVVLCSRTAFLSTSDTAVLCHGSEPLLNHFSLFLPTLYYYNPLTGIGSCVLTFCLFVGSWRFHCVIRRGGWGDLERMRQTERERERVCASKKEWQSYVTQIRLCIVVRFHI